MKDYDLGGGEEYITMPNVYENLVGMSDRKWTSVQESRKENNIKMVPKETGHECVDLTHLVHNMIHWRA
jgi:hypothetical protein